MVGATVDLRLAGPALAGWMAALWGLGHSGGVVLTVAVAALAGAGLGLLGGRRHRAWYVIGGGCCAVAVVLLPLAARLHQARSGPLARLAATHTAVTAELTVAGDPRPLAAKGTSGSPRVAVDGRLSAVVLDGRRVAVGGSVLVLGTADDWQAVLPGQRVLLTGRLTPPLSGNLLVAVLSANEPPRLIGRPPSWQRAAGAVRAGLQRASSGLPALPGGLLPGLVDGDTSGLDPVLAQRFKVAGLTHLTAVSGSNCSIMIGTVALLLGRLRASPRTTATVGFIALVGFVIVARPSPSVLRAAVMAGIALVGLAAGRQRAALPALAASCLGLLVVQPQLAANLGFALSASATAGLLLIAPGWAAALRRRRVPGGLAESVAVAAAAHLVTMPLIAAYSGQVSLVAVPANVLAEPVIAAVTVLGLLAGLTSVLWLPAAALLAQLAGWPCRWLVWVADFFGTLPGASLPWPAGVSGGLLLVATVLLVGLLCRRPAARAPLAVAALVALLVQIPLRALAPGWPPVGWLIVACSVGQGDAIALDAGGGAAVVIDAGPDPVAVDRCLRQLGVRRVPLLVLTHFHLDHVGGIAGVAHQRPVDRALVSPLAEPASGRRLVTAALGAGVPLTLLAPGTVVNVGPIRLDVLGPPHAYSGTRSDPNNSSVVLRATVAGERILLPGDAEIEAQDDLLATGTDLRADLLKVPHHGSAYSDPRFLRAVQARLALISVGRDNDYGHPSPTLLTTLRRLGVPVRRTDQDGDIAVARRGARLQVVLHQPAAAGPIRRDLAGPVPATPALDRQTVSRSPAGPSQATFAVAWPRARDGRGQAAAQPQPRARSPPLPGLSVPRDTMLLCQQRRPPRH